MVRRYDRSVLGDIQTTASGAMRIRANLTRVGIFVYTRADGTKIRELRPPEEVFKAESIASAKGLAVTDLHPQQMVTDESWRGVARGHIADNVEISEDKFLQADVVVSDADLKKKIADGERRELSMGYFADIDETPGTWINGEAYDTVQRNIEYNHAAVGPVNWGRAGNEVRMLLDSNDNMRPFGAPPQPEKPEMTVKLIKIGDREYTYGSREHMDAIEHGFAAEVKDVVAKLDAANGKIEALQKENKSLTEKLDEATSPAVIAKAAAARAKLITSASMFVEDGKTEDFDSKTDSEIMEFVLKADDKDVDLEGKNPDYVRGMFEGVVAKRKAAKDSAGSSSIKNSVSGEGEPPPTPKNDKDETPLWQEPLAIHVSR